MISKNRVRTMTRLASYEANEGKKDLKISAYYRKDYASMHTLLSVILMTIGYAFLIALIVLAGMDWIVAHIKTSLLIRIGIGIGIGYVVFLVLFIIVANSFYKNRHTQARQRVKRYNRDLILLAKGYAKEKK